MRVLLAEDEKELREALAEILRQHNFSVDEVKNGQEAIDYLELGANYDCLVLDLMMPIMDGITVIKEARKKQISIPILVLSAKSEIEDRVYGLDVGADDYLVKPFNSKELIARIRALTRRPINDHTSNLEFGNIVLNRTDYTLSSNKQELTLPNKEFQILELLMSNPRHIVTSEALFSRIWGYDTEVDQNTVWVTISNLRNKLSSIKANVMIKSVRNVGYTLEVQDD